jgi:hypothetical protein
MKLVELERMSADDLWKLHVEVGEALAVIANANARMTRSSAADIIQSGFREGNR